MFELSGFYCTALLSANKKTSPLENPPLLTLELSPHRHMHVCPDSL